MGKSTIQQQYVSNELTHFVGKELKPEEQYALLVKILTEGQLRSPGYPIDGPPHKIDVWFRYRDLPTIDPNMMVNPKMVCFCDIPVRDLRIHMTKYGEFGLSFLKTFLIAEGANPVFYLSQDSVASLSDGDITQSDLFRALCDKYALLIEHLDTTAQQHRPTPKTRLVGRIRSTKAGGFGFAAPQKDGPGEVEAPSSPFPLPPDLKQAFDRFSEYLDHQFFSFVKFFDATKSDSHTKNYYMEREWRVPGRLDFGIGNVHTIILPKCFCPKLEADLPSYNGFICPVEDL